MNKMNKKQYTEWCYSQMKKYGVRMPETYSADELEYLNPGIPRDFIDNHVKERDNNV